MTIQKLRNKITSVYKVTPTSVARMIRSLTLLLNTKNALKSFSNIDFEAGALPKATHDEHETIWEIPV